MLPLALAALGAVLLLGGSKAKAATTARTRPAPRLVAPGNVVLMPSKPKSAAKTAPKGSAKTYDVKIGPAKIIKTGPAKAATTSNISAPLTRSPSQGAGPSMSAPLSADIPQDSVTPAPRKDSTSRSQPSGFNPTAARRSAPSIANHLKRSGKAKYDRRLLKQWQTQAGLTADGLYGPASRGALVYFGVKDPPAPFAGSGTTPYTPKG